MSTPLSETGRLTDAAPGLAPRRMRPRAPGFTLIELVAVMTVLSILALAMVVGTGAGSLMGRDRDSAAGTAARNFESAVRTARASAFHSRTPHGLLPRPDGWQMLVRDHDAGGWRPASEGHARGIGWVINGTAHFPTPPLTDTAPRPLVVFASDGRATPFTVDFHATPDRYRCETDGWEGLQCARR